MTHDAGPAEDSRTVAAAMSHAVATQSPAMAANFTHPAWAMSEAEFRAFWRAPRLASLATVNARGQPHASPIEVTLEGDCFMIPSFRDAVRMADLRENRRVVLTTWDDAWHAAIVYGSADFDDAGAEMVHLRVRPTRVYAIRAPEGHHAYREQ